MRTSHPPVLATWLLGHLRSGQKNESLTGDLVEEYRSGRSRVWYWREVLAAIAVSFFKEISAHRVRAIGAVAIGWAIWFFYQSGLSPLLVELFLPFTHKLPLFFSYGTPEGLVWWVIWLSVRAASGWIVARLYRAHATEMVLGLSASVLLWKLRDFPWTCHVVMDAIGDRRYFPPLILELMSMFLPSIFIVLGGFLASRTDRRLTHVIVD